MPELPEVETMCRDLQTRVAGKTIAAVKVYDARVIRNASGQAFVRKLKGCGIVEVSRRGKAALLRLTSGWLVAQPMMTGYFHYHADGESPEIVKATKIRISLTDGSTLLYNDIRMFGRIYLVKALEDVSYLQRIGPEPLAGDFTPQFLQEKTRLRRVPIKTLLMDYTFVSGVGNIYASEILYKSRIHPLRQANSLKAKELRAVWQHTREILTEAIAMRGTSMRDYRDASGEKGEFLNRIKVYGREGERCGCGKGTIEKIVMAQRSTFFCKHCQS